MSPMLLTLIAGAALASRPDPYENWTPPTGYLAARLDRIDEFAGTGYQGETTPCVRLEFKMVPVTPTAVTNPDINTAPTGIPSPAVFSSFTATPEQGYGSYTVNPPPQPGAYRYVFLQTQWMFYVEGVSTSDVQISNGTPATSQIFESGQGTVDVTGGVVTTNTVIKVRVIPDCAKRVYLFRTDSFDCYKTLNNVEAYVGVRSHQSWNRVNLSLVRKGATAYSIDSRKTYGQANKDGEILTDPNSPLRNVNFNGWTYKGGLFVGNAPESYKGDLSGTSRIQAELSTLTSTPVSPLLKSLRLLYLGAAPEYTNSVPLTAIPPATTDPFYSSTDGTWITRWTVDTAATGLVEVPVVGTIPAKEFANFPMDPARSKVTVALRNEPEMPNDGVPTWAYFCSAAYQSAGPQQYPITSGAPQYFFIDRTAKASWGVFPW